MKKEYLLRKHRPGTQLTFKIYSAAWLTLCGFSLNKIIIFQSADLWEIQQNEVISLPGVCIKWICMLCFMSQTYPRFFQSHHGLSGPHWWLVICATHHLLNAQYAKPNKQIQFDMFILFNLYECLLKSSWMGKLVLKHIKHTFQLARYCSGSKLQDKNREKWRWK